MAKGKDKNYRRKIEVLKAQLAAYSSRERVVVASGPEAINSPVGTKEPLFYTSIEVVKKDLIKTLVLTVISFALIAAAHFVQKSIFTL